MFEQLRQRLSTAGEIAFSVRVHPGAKRTGMKGVMADGTIRIDVAAAPEAGGANAELMRFLAKVFSVSPAHVSILRGRTSRSKTIRVVR